MPITRWTPQNVLRPVVGSFKPAAIQTKNVAKGLAPTRSGRMRSRVRITFTGAMSGILHAPGVPYIFPVTSGSRPHRISPRNKKALAGDGFGPVEGADHPGNAPNPFLQRAAALFPTLYASICRSKMRLSR